MKRLFSYILLCLLIFWIKPGYSQISRGADTAEIYLHCFWHANNLHYFYSILRSINNGREFSIQYTYDTHGSEPNPTLTGDSASGALILDYAGSDSLKVSFDFGSTFETRFVFPGKQWIVGGCVSGELYYESNDVNYPGLYRSVNFGSITTLMNSNFAMNSLMEVGALPGEVYSVVWPYVWDTIGLAFSIDYGCSFITSIIDTSLIANLGGYQITRGTDPGEFYLIRVDMDYRYHIFHTLDYGQTFELKHITQDYIHPSNWLSMKTFTAGITPGSFYYAYCTIDSGAFLDPHTKLWLHYSSDYGETFTTYFHDLDSTYTSTPIYTNSGKTIKYYPNPVSKKLTVERVKILGDVNIQIFDLTGHLQFTTQIPFDQNKVLIDVSTLSPGIYMLKVMEDEKVFGVEKVVVGK